MKSFTSTRRALIATSAALAFTLSASAQTIPPCSTGGTGGVIPASGTGGGGTYQTALPPNPGVFTLAATATPGSTCVTEVTLRGLTHTFVGDVQFVLEDPGLNKYNLYCRAGTSSTAFSSCDYGGDYTIVSPCTGGLGNPASCSGTAILPPGTYDQRFANWTGGLGISNTPLSSIPAVTGTWTLYAYDWAGGDVGTLTSWEICFGTPPAAAAPTLAPALSSPANGATTCDSVVLTWAAVNCATSYDVDVDGTIYGPVAGLSFTTPVLAAGPHTWTVRGTNGTGNGPYAALRSFTSTAVAPSTAPALSSPANAAVVSQPVALSWTAATCATSYEIDIDGTVYGPVGTLNFTAPMLTPGVHTWMVRGLNTYGAGAYSASRTFDALGPPPASTCAGAAGAGGAIPTAGTGGTGAVWPTTFPSSPFSSTASVTTPAGSTKIVRVKLNGLAHTWVGDLQIVLDDPSGTRHNILHRAGSTGAAVGSGCDLLVGTYSFYETYGPFIETGCGTNIPPGNYKQNAGAWVSGTNSVFNTPLESIPVIAGTNNWTLTVYDWASGDTGTFTSWELCFDTVPVTVLDCQTSPTVSQTCDSVASFTGVPSATTGTFITTFGGLNAQANGVVFYGITGPNNAMWSPESLLCVKAPTQRLNGVSGAFGNSGGVIGNCDGSYSFDMNTIIQAAGGFLGAPMSPGTTVDMQAWVRDPASSKTTNLSDSLSFTVGP